MRRNGYLDEHVEVIDAKHLRFGSSNLVQMGLLFFRLRYKENLLIYTCFW